MNVGTICPHCKHSRTDADDSTPAWVCPACGKKYYEVEKKKSLWVYVYDAALATPPSRLPKLGRCAACRKKVSLEAPACPGCGHPPPYQTSVIKPWSESSTSERAITLSVAAIIVLLISVFIFAASQPKPAGPVNSPIDGSVFGVVQYLKSGYLNDPDSYQSVAWGKVVQENGMWKVWHRYRARNGFGGYRVEEMVFFLDDNGRVIRTTP